MVWLSNTVDTSKWRSVPMMAENEFYRGVEWYMYWKGGDEPAASIRPSQAQFTAIRELLRCRVFYVDLGLLHPHDIRTSRANRWTDWIDQKGVPHRAEVHGPATPVNWKDNWAVFECHYNGKCCTPTPH